MSKEIHRREAARRKNRNTKIGKAFVVGLLVVVVPLMLYAVTQA